MKGVWNKYRKQWTCNKIQDIYIYIYWNVKQIRVMLEKEKKCQLNIENQWKYKTNQENHEFAKNFIETVKM